MMWDTMTKLINAHKNLYTAHTKPGQLLRQRILHVFCGKITAFQYSWTIWGCVGCHMVRFMLFTNQYINSVLHIQKHPCKSTMNIKCSYANHVLFLSYHPGLPADNPQQLEEVSQIGPSGNCICRQCLVSEPPAITESNDGYHALHEVRVSTYFDICNSEERFIIVWDSMDCWKDKEGDL